MTNLSPESEKSRDASSSGRFHCRTQIRGSIRLPPGWRELKLAEEKGDKTHERTRRTAFAAAKYRTLAAFCLCITSNYRPAKF